MGPEVGEFVWSLTWLNVVNGRNSQARPHSAQRVQGNSGRRGQLRNAGHVQADSREGTQNTSRTRAGSVLVFRKSKSPSTYSPFLLQLLKTTHFHVGTDVIPGWTHSNHPQHRVRYIFIRLRAGGNAHSTVRGPGWIPPNITSHMLGDRINKGYMITWWRDLYCGKSCF